MGGFRPRDVCALADRPTGAHADGWRMLHPAGLIVAVVESVKGIVSLFVTLLVILRRHLSGPVIALALAVAIAAALAQPIARWASTRYRLGADALSFRSGVFFRKDRTISYGSIHAINGSSPIYLRPFGVVRLTVSAAGSGEADITLDAVPASLQLELERLRSRACARTHDAGTDVATRADAVSESIAAAESSDTATGPTTDANGSAVPSGSVLVCREDSPAVMQTPPSFIPPSAASSPVVPSPVVPSPARGEGPVFRASTRDILLFAITDLGFLAAAVVVYGFVQNVQDMLPQDWTMAAERTVGDYAASGVLAIVLLVLACVIVLMIVSIATSLLRFHGFEVWRRGDDLVVVRGLVTRRTTTIPVSRIQTVIIRRSMLRRPFHLCSVGLGLSSSATGGENEENAVSAALILPVIGTRRVHEVLHAMLPEWDVREPIDVSTGRAAAIAPTIRRTGRGLLRYYVTMPIVAAIAATGAVGVATAMTTGWRFWWTTLIPFAAGAWWTACRWLKSRTEGYAIAPHRIIVTGAKGLTTFTMTTRRSRVQSITRATTPWREPRGIERVRMSLFVMNGINELRFMVLDRSDADALEHWLEA